MSYIDKQALIDRFGTEEIDQLLLSDSPTGTDTEVRVDEACGDASELVDSYLKPGGYDTPIPGEAPNIVKRYACDIARYFLWDNGASEEVNLRYKSAISFLSSVSSGKVKLPVNPDENQSESSLAIGRVETGDGSTNLDLEGY